MDRFTVMTFNIRYDEEADGRLSWRHRRDLALATIRAHDPDLLGLQEPTVSQWADIAAVLPGWLPFGIAGAGSRLLNLRNLALGLVVAILSSAVPFSLEFAALRRLSRPAFGILMSLEPAMAAVVGFIVLEESLLWSQWVAVLCVVAASASATRSASPDG